MKQKKEKYLQFFREILNEQVKELVSWIEEERGPFSKEYVDLWYNRYKQLTGKYQ